MNKIHAKSLLQSKWTKVEVLDKEKHFMVTCIEFDDNQNVIECIIEAVMTHNEYSIDWRELKESNKWLIGWC